MGNAYSVPGNTRRDDSHKLADRLCLLPQILNDMKKIAFFLLLTTVTVLLAGIPLSMFAFDSTQDAFEYKGPLFDFYCFTLWMLIAATIAAAMAAYGVKDHRYDGKRKDRIFYDEVGKWEEPKMTDLQREWDEYQNNDRRPRFWPSKKK